MTQKITTRDIEKLSAFLDNNLTRSEHVRLEARLAAQPGLQEILLDLRQARAILKHTPRQRVPRNFILTPKMVGMRPPMPRSVPIFRLASITAAFLLFLTFAFNVIGPIASGAGMAAAPQLSQSGGGCGYDNPADCGDVAMEAIPFGVGGGLPETATPEEMAAMAIAPEAFDAITPGATPEASLRAMPTPTQVANGAPTDVPVTDAAVSEKSQPQQSQPQQSQPILNPFQMSLIVLVLVFGGGALLFRLINVQRWRKRL